MRSFVCRNSGDMTRAMAHRVAQHLRVRLNEAPQVRIAFSGTQPLPLFTALSREPLEWSRVIVMLTDDHVVPFDSFDSHARLIRHTLLRGQAARATFEPINLRGGRCPRSVFDSANAHYVQPDVAVLGMGQDGRLGLITSDAQELDVALSGRAEPGYIVLHAPSCRTRRISMNLAALLGCRQIFLGVSGTDNLAVFQSARLTPSPALPISMIMHQERVAVDVYRTN